MRTSPAAGSNRFPHCISRQPLSFTDIPLFPLCHCLSYAQVVTLHCASSWGWSPTLDFQLHFQATFTWRQLEKIWRKKQENIHCIALIRPLYLNPSRISFKAIKGLLLMLKKKCFGHKNVDKTLVIFLKRRSVFPVSMFFWKQSRHGGLHDHHTSTRSNTGPWSLKNRTACRADALERVHGFSLLGFFYDALWLNNNIKQGLYVLHNGGFLIVVFSTWFICSHKTLGRQTGNWIPQIQNPHCDCNSKKVDQISTLAFSKEERLGGSLTALSSHDSSSLHIPEPHSSYHSERFMWRGITVAI